MTSWLYINAQSAEAAAAECIPTHGTKLENRDGQRHENGHSGIWSAFPENLPLLL